MRPTLRATALAATTAALLLGSGAAALAEVNVIAVPVISHNDGLSTNLAPHLPEFGGDDEPHMSFDHFDGVEDMDDFDDFDEFEGWGGRADD